MNNSIINNLLSKLSRKYGYNVTVLDLLDFYACGVLVLTDAQENAILSIN